MKQKNGYWTKERCIDESKKYITLSDFCRNSKSAYNSAKKNGWIDLLPLKSSYRFPKNYWTKDRCLEEALKYNNRTDFQNNSKGAYNSSMNNGWYDEVCSHMKKTETLPYGYWTYDRCKEEVMKYDDLMSFREGSKSAYGAVLKNGWYKDLTSILEKGEKSEDFSYEFCISKSNECETRSEFREKYPSVYNCSRRNGWLDEICNHMPLRKYTYTKEDCALEALKYETKSDFRIFSSRYYFCSIKNDWLDDVCSHMMKIGNRYKRCIYSAEFTDNHVYIGLTFNFDKRVIEHMSAKPYKSAVKSYIVDSGLDPKFIRITEYIDSFEASKLEGEIKEEYVKNGWIALNKVKCGGLGGSKL